MPQGNVSFRLVEKQPNFEEIFQSRNPPNVKIVKGMKIEETALSTQVDFANRDLGGGVLNNGMVQEEIRFMMCPEMIVGMIVCNRMKQNQAISIVGAQAYSSYSGYSYNTKWEPLKRCDERQNTPEWRDKFQRLRIECLAIDALHFKGTPQTTLRQQLKREMIFRELHKAYVGFSAQPGFTEIPIVSGWWGCGAFNGNKPLKFLIQVIAAAAAKRPLLICPFNENEMADDCRKFIGTIMKENMTCGNLLRLLMKLAGQNPPEEFSENIVFASLEHELKKNKREVAEKRK
uniref:Poly(ADP-ribose) glycohydrolase n=1 Tax=Caenorhabditis japonica TaxID=281687 RepID=A0A8R1IGI3_CAEJA